MAHQDFLWPQHGDEPDAAHFSYWLGQEGLSGYVEEGFHLNPDWANDTLDISDGKAYVMRGTFDTTSPDIPTETMDGNLFVAGKTAETGVVLGANTLNYLYLDPNFGSDDSPQFEVVQNEANATAEALQIAHVYTDEERIVLKNREHPIISSTSPLGGPIRRHLEEGETMVIEEDESFIVSEYFEPGQGDLTVKGDMVIRDFEKENIKRDEFEAEIASLQSQIDSLQTQLNDHEAATSAHGSDGDVAGTNEVQTVQTNLDDHEAATTAHGSNGTVAGSNDVDTVQTNLTDHEDALIAHGSNGEVAGMNDLA